MRPRHVSVFLPRPTPIYQNLLRQMLRGFRAAGVQADGACRLLPESQLRAWCRHHGSIAVFEMNRARCDVPSLSKDIRHITWIVDNAGKSLDAFGGSDITYLFCHNWMDLYPHRSLHRVFPPGTCPVEYPRGRAEPGSNVTFVGHIPNPWSEAELDRPLTPNKDYRFRDALPELCRETRERWNHLYTVDGALEIMQANALRACGQRMALDDALRYDICCRISRQVNRTGLIDAVLCHTDSVALYGPPNWLRWPRYAPYYRRYLETPAQMADVYRNARINLHEGEGMHFRLLDAMSAGGFLFFREASHDRLPHGIRDYFEPYEHYVPFSLDDFGEKCARYSADPAACERIRNRAAQEVRARHTWRHRAQQVLADLAQL